MHVSLSGRYTNIEDAIVWELVKNKRPPKNGQYQISLSKLRTLNDNIAPDDRI